MFSIMSSDQFQRVNGEFIIDMKQKQKTLKKLLRDNQTIQKVLDIIGSDTIAEHFINDRDHEQELFKVDPQFLSFAYQNLQEKDVSQSEEELFKVDPQFLSFAYQNLQEKDVSQSEDERNLIKTDILSQGLPQLVAIFRSKSMISLFQYLNTIRHKEYKQHSYYGYLLVSRYPDQFFIGTKCTHYHCKTTARKIQAEYGIFRAVQDSQQEVNDQIQQDSDFINDQESQEIVMVKKRKKKVRNSQKDASEEEKPVKSSKNRKKKPKSDQQNSQQLKIKNYKKNKKMQLYNEEDESYNELIIQVFQKLQPNEILEALDYKILFEFLSEKHIEMLSSIKDDMYIAVKFNEKQAKRQKKYAKKSKTHNKKLSKSKINLKDLSLYDLLVECSKHDLIQPEDLLQWETKYELQQHPKLAHKLLEINPQGYVIQGEYMGSIQNDISIYIQTAYRQYQEKKDHQKQQQQQEEVEELQNDEEGESGFIREDDDQIEQSNYSIDSAQQQLDDSK